VKCRELHAKINTNRPKAEQLGVPDVISLSSSYVLVDEPPMGHCVPKIVIPWGGTSCPPRVPPVPLAGG
jgi:hypothetical protein